MPQSPAHMMARCGCGNASPPTAAWRCAAVLEGHKGAVRGVALAAGGLARLRLDRRYGSSVGALIPRPRPGPVPPYSGSKGASFWWRGADGRRPRAVSGSADGTVRVWDRERTRRPGLRRRPRGPRGQCYGVAMSADGRRAVSGSATTVRVWDLRLHDRVLLGRRPRRARMPSAGVAAARRRPPRRLGLRGRDGAGVGPSRNLPRARPRDQTIYTNAKVLLTGDSGAGKTGLAERLVHNAFTPTFSTDGVWATQLKLEEDGPTPGGCGAGDLALGLRRAGRLPADPPALHGRDRPGPAGLRPPEGQPVRGRWPSGTATSPGPRRVGPSSSGSSPAGATVAGCASAAGRSSEFQERRGFAGYHETSALTGRRLRRAPQGDRRVDPLGQAAEDVVADDLQADQGRDPQAQGRRPRAVADGRAEAGARNCG